MRMTMATRTVIHTLLDMGPGEHYGMQICNEAGMTSSVVHPILDRLENAGWLTSRWEDPNPNDPGRARRHYYRFAVGGADKARARLGITHADATRTPL